MLRFITLLVIAVMFSGTSSANAEHAVITMEVIGPDGKALAKSDEEPPIGGSLPRAKVTARVGDPLVLQFILTNVYPHGVLKDVKVRYFIVEIDKVGQKALPPIDAKKGSDEEKEVRGKIVTRGHVIMNFKPKCRIGTRLMFRIDKPGVYLVRLDTNNTKADHEHIAGIDLEVK
jgi:hypothetical protein